jgi:hypothetical protein
LVKGGVYRAAALDEKLRNLASSGKSTLRAVASRSATEFWISSFDSRTIRLGGGRHRLVSTAPSFASLGFEP